MSRWDKVCGRCGASDWTYECRHGTCSGYLSRVQAIEAAEDHADQTAFDAWRERGL